MKINPDLKPLYANLKRLEIGKFLLLKEFNHFLIENNLDEDWEEIHDDVKEQKGSFRQVLIIAEDEEETLLLLLSLIYENYSKDFISIFTKLMIEFVKYCSYTLDLHPLYQNLKDIEISRENLLYFISTIRNEQASEQKTDPKTNFNQANGYYVDSSRIDELKDIKQKNCDYTRLIQLLDELNLAWRNDMYMSVSMIVRAIIDHVPPIFDKKTFSEVSGGHGTRSFKDSMIILDKQSRKIADSHLHTPIRPKENLPNKSQVDVSPSLNCLIQEIIRINKA